MEKCPGNGFADVDEFDCLDYRSKPSIVNGYSNFNDSDTDPRQFNVLDEIGEDNVSDKDSDGTESYDSEVPDEEIEAMLEEGLPEEFKSRKRKRGRNDGYAVSPSNGNFYSLCFGRVKFNRRYFCRRDADETVRRA